MYPRAIHQSTFRQLQIYQAMGGRAALRAIPLIHGPDGAKLSSATVRSGSKPIATWVPAGGAAICSGSAGATAATGIISTGQAISGSTWMRSAAVRRVSTSSSSTASTVTICARPTMRLAQDVAQRLGVAGVERSESGAGVSGGKAPPDAGKRLADNARFP
jgi:hypothetical protein